MEIQNLDDTRERAVRAIAQVSEVPRQLAGLVSDLADLYTESGQTLQGSFSAVSKPNFVRTSEVRKMKDKMRKCYVTEKMESQQKKVSLQS